MNDVPPGPWMYDVSTLLESSRPRARVPWRVYMALAGFVAITTVYAAGKASPQFAGLAEALALACGLSVGFGFLMLMRSAGRRMMEEKRVVDSAEELVMLRRWPEAAVRLGAVLGQPMMMPMARAQALHLLSGVLSRYHRYDDAITVQNALLDDEPIDGSTELSVRVSRAMIMLRQDHLVDADRAIIDLRKRWGRARESAAAAADAGVEAALNFPRDSGGVALVELYRDIRTGHSAEAIEIYDRTVAAMKAQLGHRVADAMALVAVAHDRLGDEATARKRFEEATLLQPLVELSRRYSEVETLTAKYGASVAPAGM